jgi:hypothetical protein
MYQHWKLEPQLKHGIQFILIFKWREILDNIGYKI